MEKQKVYESEHLILYWLEPTKLHLAEWRGLLSGEPLRQAFRTCIAAAQARPAQSWIADVRDYGPTNAEDDAWISETFFPALVDTGVRYFAIILSADFRTGMATRRVLQRVGNSELHFSYHTSVDEAVRWLHS
mgnify:FL=1